MGEVDRIDIQSSNAAGLPVRFVVTDKKGNRFSLNGEELRWAFNTTAPKDALLYSSFFKPVNEDATIQFVEGHGWGHGVGLCNGAAKPRRSRTCGTRTSCCRHTRGRSCCGRIE